jgi:hypothetical protein
VAATRDRAGRVTRTLLLAVVVVALCHFVVVVMTFPVAYSMAMSDFDHEPTFTSRAGHTLAWVLDAVLFQPFHPLSRRTSPWTLGRGYVGLVLNSLAWGVAAASIVGIRIIVRRHVAGGLAT